MTIGLATIYDVAECAGVSVATVSRYLNKTHRIAEDKVALIESAIVSLDYTPKNKRSTQRNMTLGIIAPSFDSPFVSDILTGIDDKANQSCYRLVVETTGWTETGEMKHLRHFKAMGVDGLIIVVGSVEIELIKNIMGDIPVLLIGREENSHYPVVWSDNLIGGMMATNYLLQLGHTKIAHVHGNLTSFDAANRLKGYQQSLQKAGISVDDALIIDGNYASQDSLESVTRLIESGAEFTAIFAANDLSAFGAVQALHQKGIRVPDDVSVIGFDDHVMCRFFIPQLTTVKQPLFEMGQLGFENICRVINGQSLDVESPKLEIVARESTLMYSE